MIRALVVALVVLVALTTGSARADDAREFAAIDAGIARGELTVDAGITALEALGARRPVTRWTDDACAEAARLAERAGDLARARRDLACVIALGEDPRLVERARAALARLAPTAGWEVVVAEHDRLVASLATGDPTRALEALEALVRAHPNYPRGIAARLTLARGWEAEGQLARAIPWLVDATQIAETPLDRERTRTDLARTLVRHDHARARAAIADVVDPIMRTVLEDELASVVRRRWLHRAAWLALAIAAAAAVVAARRSWRRP
ncbi:MAG: hypothetical protein NT062_35890, partial [Proteobacteria bacterium]|nr:hypothetical protein [Pseudomonadota bacterium]